MWHDDAMLPSEPTGSKDADTVASLRAEIELLRARLADAMSGRSTAERALGQRTDALAVSERTLGQRTDALEVSDRKFSSLFLTAPIGLALVDLDGRFTEANPALQALLGYDLSALREISVLELAYPADRPILQALYASLLAGEREVVDTELRCLRQDGGVIWIHCTAHLVRDGAHTPRVTIGIADVTQRMKTHLELQESWAKYRLLVEQSPETIVVHSQGVIRYINPAGVALLGAPSAEVVVGRPVLDFVVPAYQDLVRSRIHQVQGENTAAPIAQMAFYRMDGSVIDVETASAPIEFEGQPASQVIVRDMTERTRTEAELKRLNAELHERSHAFERELDRRTEALRASEAALREQYDQLRQLARLKDDLVNAVSHELRTPLTSIRGFAEFLEDDIAGPLTPVQRSFVAQIQEGALRLQRLVDDLLDFARLEAGSFKLAEQEADLARLTSEVLDSLRPQAVRKGIAFQAQIPQTPVPARIDPGRIGQVLINLVGNAIKFTAPGGAIDIRLTEGNQRIRLEVRDTGIGIAPEHLPRLFEKFYQVESSLTREAGGAGLGLSISRALIEAHGGQLGASSDLGKGSVFWFELPRAPEAPAGADPKA